MSLKKLSTALLLSLVAPTYGTSYIDNTTDATLNILCGVTAIGNVPANTKTAIPENCTQVHMQYTGSCDETKPFKPNCWTTCPLPLNDTDINNVTYQARYNPYWGDYGNPNSMGMLMCNFPPATPAKPRSLAVENRTQATLNVSFRSSDDDMARSHECASTQINPGERATYNDVDLCGPRATLFVQYKGSASTPADWDECPSNARDGVAYAIPFTTPSVEHPVPGCRSS